MRVVLAGGGTAGHIEPALALADALRRLDPTHRHHLPGHRARPGDPAGPRRGATSWSWSRRCRCPGRITPAAADRARPAGRARSTPRRRSSTGSRPTSWSASAATSRPPPTWPPGGAACRSSCTRPTPGPAWPTGWAPGSPSTSSPASPTRRCRTAEYIGIPLRREIVDARPAVHGRQGARLLRAAARPAHAAGLRRLPGGRSLNQAALRRRARAARGRRPGAARRSARRTPSSASRRPATRSTSCCRTCDRMDLAYAAADFALCRSGAHDLRRADRRRACPPPTSRCRTATASSALNAEPIVAGRRRPAGRRRASCHAEWIIAATCCPSCHDPERVAAMSEAAVRTGPQGRRRHARPGRCLDDSRDEPRQAGRSRSTADRAGAGALHRHRRRRHVGHRPHPARARRPRVRQRRRRSSDLLAELRELGATVHVGHAASHIRDVDTVVVSTAIRDSNPELGEALRAAGCGSSRGPPRSPPSWPGAPRVAVAGTHGKTTTTSMLTVALQKCGRRPVLLRRRPARHHRARRRRGLRRGVRRRGRRERRLVPHAGARHRRGDQRRGRPPGQLRRPASGPRQLRPLRRAGRPALLVVCADDPGSRRAGRRGARARPEVMHVRRGRGRRLPGRAASGPTGSAPASPSRPRRRSGRCGWPFPGAHNALNATAAIAVAVELGLPVRGDQRTGWPPSPAPSAASRPRARRAASRSSTATPTTRPSWPPTCGPRATWSASCSGTAGSSRSSSRTCTRRTRFFADEFGAALGLADEAIVLDVYGAREDPEPGVTGALVAAKVPLPARAGGLRAGRGPRCRRWWPRRARAGRHRAHHGRGRRDRARARRSWPGCPPDRLAAGGPGTGRPSAVTALGHRPAVGRLPVRLRLRTAAGGGPGDREGRPVAWREVYVRAAA